MTFSFFVYCRSFLLFIKNKSENRQPKVLKTTRPLPLENGLWLVRATYAGPYNVLILL
jgi:hypothetical protein